ncbi:MAG TPA: bifunctional 2-C-methyl-D-erythritol 4-phosphate cytidylyltransferase/2-C-methyl-D-erythritol 2,4-cyclodiphosphate synthase [Stellaceae bacterium]|nr:bifunctional 2-C-methyl-D-erythritol 4-phosphate cytidylyltransferase/2-C-methyl-D-erythritol 2,4-cyclodiphosphate synthase [Stellaceae bacterium]
MASTQALVLAAGRGTRFGGTLPKQYLPLGGATVLRHAIAAFAAHPRIDGVLVAIRPEDRALYDAAVAALDLPPPVAGGTERQDSVRLGLEALAPQAPARVLIHDGARPFPGAAVIDRVLDALDRGAAAAIPGLPLGDTLKRVEDGVIRATVDRTGLWRVQTPQGFDFATILAAHRAASGRALTDDAAVVETAGAAPLIVAGSEDNLKITTAADLAAAERLLAAGPFASPGDVRVGQGFDVHPFGPGDGLMVCGVRIAHGAGVVGHSDADVGLHALTDALLGAIGAGDIGMHFPPSDPQWKGASSDRFLAHAAGLVRARGGSIAALDVTIVCERPKIAPHRAAMVERVAAIAGIAAERVSVKATTTERLGFTGRGEGIAAQAVATVRLPL